MAKDAFGYGTEEKPNWNDLGRDQKLDVQKQIGDYILDSMPEHVLKKLSKDQHYDIARQLLESEEGNIEKAVKRMEDLIKKANEIYN